MHHSDQKSVGDNKHYVTDLGFNGIVPEGTLEQWSLNNQCLEPKSKIKMYYLAQEIAVAAAVWL